MITLENILLKSASRHSHLCPRQVLGARIGLAGLTALGIGAPVTNKCALVILETDGCFADGVEIATGCSIGHRTLRIEDYGKIAAAFINLQTGQAVRVTPRLDIRRRSDGYFPEEESHYSAMLKAYQVLPETELLSIMPIRISPSIESIMSQPGLRANCSQCGEEIINQREILQGQSVFCVACATTAYYLPEMQIRTTKKE